MEKYLISPDDCLILRAFKHAKSLREAATLLGCDPAGLTRKVAQISAEHGLIQKIDNRWKLTAKGIELVSWTESSILSQKQLLNERGQCRIGSTMWLGEAILIPNYKKLVSTFDHQANFSFHVPTNSFEGFLQEGSVDIAIVCHAPETPEIEHRRIAEEEWVIVVPKLFDLKKMRTLEDLTQKTFIRHGQLNTDHFIPQLSSYINLDSIIVDNLIGIRSAVIEGLGWSIVPKISVAKNLDRGELKIFPYKINTQDRHVCIWWLRHNRHAKKFAPKIQQWLKEALS